MTESLSLSWSLSLRGPLSEPVSSSGLILRRLAEEERFLELKRKGEMLRPDRPNALRRFDFFWERSSSWWEEAAGTVAATAVRVGGVCDLELTDGEWVARAVMRSADGHHGSECGGQGCIGLFLVLVARADGRCAHHAGLSTCVETSEAESDEVEQVGRRGMVEWNEGGQERGLLGMTHSSHLALPVGSQ